MIGKAMVLVLVLRHRFANRDKIGSVTAPTLLFHGGSDTLILAQHSVALA